MTFGRPRKETSTCRKCALEKHRDAAGRFTCSACDTERSRAWRTNNIDKARAKDRRFRDRNRGRVNAWHMQPLKDAKKRHRVEVFGDDVLDLFNTQGGICLYSGVSLCPSPHARTPRQPSIDRINSKGHYSKDNIGIACQSINYAKSNYTAEDFVSFLHDVARSLPQAPCLLDPRFQHLSETVPQDVLSHDMAEYKVRLPKGFE